MAKSFLQLLGRQIPKTYPMREKPRNSGVFSLLEPQNIVVNQVRVHNCKLK